MSTATTPPALGYTNAACFPQWLTSSHMRTHSCTKLEVNQSFTYQYFTSPKYSNFCCIKISSVTHSESRTTGRPSPLALKAHAQRLTARGLEPHAVWAQVPARPLPDTWPGPAADPRGSCFLPCEARITAASTGLSRGFPETRVKGFGTLPSPQQTNISCSSRQQQQLHSPQALRILSFLLPQQCPPPLLKIPWCPPSV